MNASATAENDGVVASRRSSCRRSDPKVADPGETRNDGDGSPVSPRGEEERRTDDSSQRWGTVVGYRARTTAHVARVSRANEEGEDDDDDVRRG